VKLFKRSSWRVQKCSSPLNLNKPLLLDNRSQPCHHHYAFNCCIVCGHAVPDANGNFLIHTDCITHTYLLVVLQSVIFLTWIQGVT
jgi:hypothetical protein